MSLRNSITSIKRRSWMMENNENIWRFLTEEQRKGRNHISFDDVETAKKSANFIQPASPSVLQNGEKEVPVEVKGEATSSPENSESPSVSDNRKIFKPSSEEDQLDVPTLPKRLDEPPIKEESKVIKIEVDSSPPAEQIHTSKTTSAAASESEKEFKPSYPPTPPKELQSPRGRPENYDLFNKVFNKSSDHFYPLLLFVI